MDDAVSDLYAKFDDDRLWNEKALADRKSATTRPQEQEQQQEQHSQRLETRFRV